MKFKDITKRNWTPTDFMNRTNQGNFPYPAFADDLNKVGDDVARIYNNFKTASLGGFTAATGATAGVYVSDEDVDTDMKIVGLSVHNVTASSGHPTVASIRKKSTGYGFDLIVTNALPGNLDVSGLDIDYIIGKEL